MFDTPVLMWLTTHLHLLLQGREPRSLLLQQARLPQHHGPQLLHARGRCHVLAYDDQADRTDTLPL